MNTTTSFQLPAPAYECTAGSSSRGSNNRSIFTITTVKTLPNAFTQDAAVGAYVLTSLHWSNGGSAAPIVRLEGNASSKMLRDLAKSLTEIAGIMDKQRRTLTELNGRSLATQKMKKAHEAE
jgi:hypothetical protein